MARKTIIVDDLTDAEIDDEPVVIDITLKITPPGNDVEALEFASEWETGDNTAESLRALVEFADLATFVSRMRTVIKLTADPDTVRKWAREKHPELNIQTRGRVPAEVMALYRREVVQKLNPVSTPTTPAANAAGAANNSGGRA